jgi:hypothetical protein
MGWHKMDSSGSGQGPVAGSFGFRTILGNSSVAERLVRRNDDSSPWS